jgi:hypothetical protein
VDRLFQTLAIRQIAEAGRPDPAAMRPSLLGRVG